MDTLKRIDFAYQARKRSRIAARARRPTGLKPWRCRPESVAARRIKPHQPTVIRMHTALGLRYLEVRGLADFSHCMNADGSTRIVPLVIEAQHYRDQTGKLTKMSGRVQSTGV